MIKNWDRHELPMDFSTIDTEIGKPSDLDMFYIRKNYAILGEIKHESGEFNKIQRRLYEEMANALTYKDVLVLYITHPYRVEDGYKKVFVADCLVKEYYFKPKYEKGVRVDPLWTRPDKPISVNDFMLRFIAKEEEKLEKEKRTI